MNNRLLFFVLIACTGVLTSCASYIRVFEAKSVPNENAMQSRVITVPSDTITMQFFGDYCFETVKKEFILISDRDVRKILSQTPELAEGKQVLFTYTDLQDYNNVFGFYYNLEDLDAVRKHYAVKPYKEHFNGIIYVYAHADYTVADVFKQVNGGIIRFLIISKQAGESQRQAFLEHEVNELYFVRN